MKQKLVFEHTFTLDASNEDSNRKGNKGFAGVEIHSADKSE